jgi:zona occludens toxin
MSIVAYVGLPGHGKSYGIVENVIIPSLKQKRNVYTNIPMNTEKCQADFGLSVIPFDPVDIIKNPFWFRDVFIAGSIFVLDEVWRLWPAGLKANVVREEDKIFLAEHRHLVGENGFSTEIYLVTQDLSQVSMFARALVENTFRMVKRSNIGLDNRFRVDVYSGAVTGNKPSANLREREIHGGKFKKEIYAYYKSHTKSQTGEAGNETRTDQRFNVLGRLSIKLGFALVIMCIVFVYFGFGKVQTMYKPTPKYAPQNIQNSSRVNSSVPYRVPAGARVAVEDRPQPKFLSSSRKFTISHIFGLPPNQQFFYKVIFDNYEVLVSSMDLKRLGYSMETINDCLVKVYGSDYNGFAMCPKAKKESGLLAGLANDMTQPISTDLR